MHKDHFQALGCSHFLGERSSCRELSWSSGNGGKNLAAAFSATSCAYFNPSAALQVALIVVMVNNNIFSTLLLLS